MNPVYEPSDDTFLMWDAIQKELELYTANTGKPLQDISFLDMGSGSGYLGFEAIKKGVGHLTCVDINEEAIKHINLFIEEEELPAKTIQSNLFENVEESFDVVVFNTPYLPHDEELFDPALHGGKKGNEVAIEFIKQLPNHLNTNAIVLLLTSSLAKPDEIEKTLEQEGFTFFKVASDKLFFEELIVYKLVKNNA